MPDPTIKLPPTPALRAALVVGMDLAASGEADGFDVQKCAAEVLDALAQPHNGDCQQMAWPCLACMANEAFYLAWRMWGRSLVTRGGKIMEFVEFRTTYPCQPEELARAIVWLERTCAELAKEQADAE